MFIRSAILALVSVGALSACSVVETMAGATATSAPLESSAGVEVTRNYDLERFNFGVPEDIEVSEAGGYYPLADVVWQRSPWRSVGANRGHVSGRG